MSKPPEVILALSALLALFVLVAMLWLTYRAIKFDSLPEVQACGFLDDLVLHGRDDSKYSECVKAYAQNVTAEYQEGKSLATAFLTLLSGVFVASLTFSDKIVHWEKAAKLPKFMMVACWMLLLGAIGLCGTGLVTLVFAFDGGGKVPLVVKTDAHDWRQPVYDVTRVFNVASLYGMLSAFAFGLALTCLLLSGISAVMRRNEIKSDDDLSI